MARDDRASARAADDEAGLGDFGGDDDRLRVHQVVLQPDHAGNGQEVGHRHRRRGDERALIRLGGDERGVQRGRCRNDERRAASTGDAVLRRRVSRDPGPSALRRPQAQHGRTADHADGQNRFIVTAPDSFECGRMVARL
jgi:hypothetical protein